MVDFRSGYVPPGVYVSADTSAVAGVVGTTSTVILLVGPGLGYRSFTDHIVFANNSDSVALTQTGVNPNSLVVSSTTAGVKTTYNITTDYQLSATNSSAPDSVSTISVVASGTIQPGATIDVSYSYADTSYYSLNQFSDFASFINVYGSPFDRSTGIVQSPISLAAQVAFENGANQIYAVALNSLGSLAEQYASAYALSAQNYDINLIIPVWPVGDGTGYPTSIAGISPFASALNGHLQDTEDSGFPRTAIVGVSDSFDTSVTPDQVAGQFSYRRVVVVWPNRLLYYNALASTPQSQTQVIGGQYLAAACGGFLANNPTAQGLTRQQVFAIAGIAPDIIAQQTTYNKNNWSARGVAVLEPNRAGRLVIRHGVSTDVSSVTTREFSIVRCQDELFTLIQQSLESANLIGTPITSDTPLSVKGIIAGALETALANNTIQGYSGLAVRQQSLPNGDPTVIEAVFIYAPTFPVNYITVSFSFNLSTGTTAATTDDTAAAIGA
jgi:hypothetical protein